MTIDVAAAANDAVTAISGAAYECLNNQSAMSRASGAPGGAPRSGGSPPVVNMAQHMLRNILQGVGRNKKDLYALERELREAGSINNNDNSSRNNNNKETKLEVDCANDIVALNNNDGDRLNCNRDMSENEMDEVEDEEDEMKDDVPLKLETDDVDETGCDESDSLKSYPAGVLSNGGVENRAKAAESDERDHFVGHQKYISNSSAAEEPVSLTKSRNNNNNIIIQEDPDEVIKDCQQSQKSEQKELKRARVENIVSCMRSSPLLVPVNGCKKRKLYHPQQHDNTAADYCADMDVGEALSENEDETMCPTEMRKKVVEKNALKNQLRTVQEQLAEMQQKYVQLCTRIEQDPMDMDEVSSETDQDEDKASIASLAKEERISPSPLSAASHNGYSPSDGIGRTSPPPVLPKMLSSKLLPQSTLPPSLPRLNPHPFPLHPSFNTAALSFLQHQIFQEQQHAAQNHMQSYRRPYHQNPAQAHPAFNNVASMYLGVSQKLALEQEARLAKEAVLASTMERQQQQSPHGVVLSTYSPQSNSPHNQQPSVQNANHSGGTATKEPSSPARHKNNHSPATPATNALSSLSSSSSLQQQQHSVMQPTTKTSADTTTVTAPPNSASKNSHTAANNALDLEGLADSLKTEITTTLSTLIDTIMSRFLQQKRSPNKTSEAEQLNKDLLLASQLLDHKSPRTKVINLSSSVPVNAEKNASSNAASYSSPSKGHSRPNSSNSSPNHGSSGAVAAANLENNANAPNVAAAARTALGSNIFAASKLGSAGLNSAAAALYSSMTNGLAGSHLTPFCVAELRSEAAAPEQNEALSLVVPQKKKRHKVTDTRITPRTVSRILAQDGVGCLQPSSILDTSKYGLSATNVGNGAPDSPPPPPRPFHHIPHSAPMLPVSLPTSVAIPNPSLHESQIFSPYTSFYGGQHQPSHHIPSSSPPGLSDHLRDSPPLPHHTSMFHPALLAAAQQQQQQHQKQQQHREQLQREQQSHHQRGSSSPDFMNLLPASGPSGDSLGPASECNSMDFDGLPPTISFSYSSSKEITHVNSSTLSPMHLRKAKLMFFWVRYPTSAVLKMYFPDIRFNKNNTAQLVKWFSNFREFYYIQMEKYARAAIADGISNADDIHVSLDSDIYRVLNLHYNRNNHIEVPSNFRYVVEQTLKEFFKAIQMGKDQDQSWKKPIYKVIGRLDDPVPEYFKSPNFLEQLE
ncbi:hypothetical protein V9T40_013261 [Parthenolecanium corni]|uniref:Homeobox protein prospero n=1 Tax=Parthenolecanium corni TaxID=536013 RepID=A0AAN9TN75_9HEMI